MTSGYYDECGEDRAFDAASDLIARALRTLSPLSNDTRGAGLGDYLAANFVMPAHIPASALPLRRFRGSKYDDGRGKRHGL